MPAAAAFPVAKLGFLLIKQISKPIAKSIAARARNSRLFREFICIPVAQMFHWYEIKMKMRMLNVSGKMTKVPKLNEAKAIEQGSEILSEAIILTIASSILIYEYNRSSKKEEAKEAAITADREKIKHKIFELEFKVDKQTTQIRELARTVIHLEEDIHKRSLARIFEKKPQVNAEVLESAKDTPTEVHLLPLEGNGATGETSHQCQTVPIEQLQINKDSFATGQSTSTAMNEKNAAYVQTLSQDHHINGAVTTPSTPEQSVNRKQGVILSAVNDILKK